MEYFDYNIIFLLVLKCWLIIFKNSWGYLYLTARGEILGFVDGKLLRKHLLRIFFLIKNKS